MDDRLVNELDEEVERLTTENEILKRELDRLGREGSPGVMHDIDKAFYKLTVQQRDAAWREIEELKRQIEELRRQK